MKQDTISSGDKMNWLRILHTAWPGGLAVVVAASAMGAAYFGTLRDKIVEKQVAAYDKTHGTSILSYYSSIDGGSIYEDYSLFDRRKLAAAQKEDTDTITTIRNASKKEALAIIMFFTTIALVSYTLLTISFRLRWTHFQISSR